MAREAAGERADARITILFRASARAGAPPRSSGSGLSRAEDKPALPHAGLGSQRVPCGSDGRCVRRAPGWNAPGLTPFLLWGHYRRDAANGSARCLTSYIFGRSSYFASTSA